MTCFNRNSLLPEQFYSDGTVAPHAFIRAVSYFQDQPSQRIPPGFPNHDQMSLDDIGWGRNIYYWDTLDVANRPKTMTANASKSRNTNIQSLCLYRLDSPVSVSNVTMSFDIVVTGTRINPFENVFPTKMFRAVLGCTMKNPSLSLWNRKMSSTPGWNISASVGANAAALDEKIYFSLYKDIKNTDISYFFAEVSFADKTLSIGQQINGSTIYFKTVSIQNFDTKFSGKVIVSLFDNADGSVGLAAKFTGPVTDSPNEFVIEQLEHTIQNNPTSNITYRSNGYFGFLDTTGYILSNFDIGTRSINSPFIMCRPSRRVYKIRFTYARTTNWSAGIDFRNWIPRLVEQVNSVYTKYFNTIFETEAIEEVSRGFYETWKYNLLDSPVTPSDFNYFVVPDSQICCGGSNTCNTGIVGCAYYPIPDCNGRGIITLNGSFSLNSETLAHELGHNFFAQHLPGYHIMSAYANAKPNFIFVAQSIIEINNAISGVCGEKAEIAPEILPYSPSAPPTPPQPPQPPTQPPTNTWRVIESAGSETLSVNNQGYIRVNNNPLVKWIGNGLPVSYDNGTWRFVAAEKINNVNTIVLRHVSGYIHFWRMNSTWDLLVSYDSWFAPGTPGFIETENTFGVDIDGDGSPSSVTSLSFTKNLPTTINLNDSDTLTLEVEAIGLNNSGATVPFPTNNNTYQWYTNQPYLDINNQLVTPTGWGKIERLSSDTPNIFRTNNWKSLTGLGYNEYKCIVTTNNIQIESNVVRVNRKPANTSLVVSSYRQRFVYPANLPPLTIQSLPLDIRNKILSIQNASNNKVIWSNPAAFSRPVSSGVLSPGKAYTISSVGRDLIKIPRATLPYTINFVTNYLGNGEPPPALIQDSGQLPTYNVDTSWSLTIQDKISDISIDKNMKIPIDQISNIDKVEKIFTYNYNNQILVYKKNYSLSSLKIIQPGVIYTIVTNEQTPFTLEYSA